MKSRAVKMILLGIKQFRDPYYQGFAAQMSLDVYKRQELASIGRTFFLLAANPMATIQNMVITLKNTSSIFLSFSLKR